MKITFEIPKVVCMVCRLPSFEYNPAKLLRIDNRTDEDESGKMVAVFTLPTGWIGMNADYSYGNFDSKKHKQHFSPWAICPACYDKGVGLTERFVPGEQTE